MVHRPQAHWSWPIATEMFLSGCAAGTYLISVTPYLLPGRGVYVSGVLASVVLALASAAILLADLSSVWLAPRAFSNQKSPVARGAAGLAVFTVLAAMTFAIAFSGMPSGVLGIAVWLGAIAAVFIMAYPGTIMGSLKAIPFWSGSVPILLLLAAGPLSGAAVVDLMGGPGDAGLDLRPATVWLLVAYAVVLLAQVAMGSQGLPATRLSVHYLTMGRLAAIFWVGVILVGIAVPLGLYLAGAWTSDAVLVRAGAFLILAGGLLMRYSLLASGIKTSVLREDALLPTYWLDH